MMVECGGLLSGRSRSLSRILWCSRSDAVIIFFDAANDFTDNDYSFWRANGLTYHLPPQTVRSFTPATARNATGNEWAASVLVAQLRRLLLPSNAS